MAWPTGAEAGLSISDALLRTTHLARAELTLSEASHHFQFVADAQQAMGRVQVWTDIIRSAPQNADLRYKIGSHLLKYDNPQHGLGWLLSVLDIDPSHVPTHRLLASYYQRRQKSERAAFHRKMVAEGEAAVSGSSPTENGLEGLDDE